MIKPKEVKQIIAKINEQDEENEQKLTRQYVCTARKFLVKFDEVMRSLSEVKKQESLILAQDKRNKNRRDSTMYIEEIFSEV